LLVLHWDQHIGGAIGLWPPSERAAARLTNARMKGADVTGRMMRRFHKTAARKWYISGMVLRPELIGTCAIRVLLGDGLCHLQCPIALLFSFSMWQAVKSSPRYCMLEVSTLLSSFKSMALEYRLKLSLLPDIGSRSTAFLSLRQAEKATD
jgi:hypothetical protein